MYELIMNEKEQKQLRAELIFAKKLGFDPAVMASPFITTIVDALSLLVYFGIASAILF